MAFNPNFLAMGGFLGQNQFPMMPMGGIMPLGLGLPPHPPPGVPPHGMGVTVPTGVASISAPPVRSSVMPDVPPSLLGAYPGPPPPLGMPFQPFQMQHQHQHHQPPLMHHKKQHHNHHHPTGPVITLFVGNITERAPDMLIRQLLSKCGNVANWKRVQGANGKLQAFGFCDFSDPESAMRAIRILHDYELGDKNLVVREGDKAKVQLAEYVKKQKPGAEGPDDVVSDETKREDGDINASISVILREHELELNRDVGNGGKDRRRNDRNADANSKSGEGIEDIEMEEEKRHLIHREIDKFRDTYKKTDDKPTEKEGRDRERPEPRRDRKPDDRSGRGDRDRNGRDRSPNRSEDKDRSSRREPEPSSKERPGNGNNNSRNDRKDRYESSSRESRNESRNESRSESRNESRNVSVEDEEELYERRRIERKTKEKETSYQERLRNWEKRENRKSRELDKDRASEVQRKEEEIKEAKRLKQFLEDYDDDRDDSKFYKGGSLARRLRDRQKENDEDERDRRQEKRELEELKRKLTDEGHPDPECEANKRLNSSDNERERERIVSLKIKELRNDIKGFRGEDDSLGGLSDSKEELHVKSFSFTGSMKLGNQSQAHGASGEASSPSAAQKRKKLSVKDIFNANDDDDQLSTSKRRKLPTLVDDSTDSNQSLLSNTNKGSGDSKSLTSEEKRKQIKNLIENIPTGKDELFKYNIEWSVLDKNLMEKRIKPWINKKITEYLGEEEQTLLEFICNKLEAKSSAQSILEDVAMVLDEEAEVFVVKMWRLLIYEIEAKKLGLAK